MSDMPKALRRALETLSKKECLEAAKWVELDVKAVHKLLAVLMARAMRSRE